MKILCFHIHIFIYKYIAAERNGINWLWLKDKDSSTTTSSVFLIEGPYVYKQQGQSLLPHL